MNCSSLAIETPKKIYIRDKGQTPVKFNPDSVKRFSPSKPLQTLLKQISRAHEFIYHLEFKCLDLTEMDVTQQLVREVRKVVIDEDPEVSDLVLKIEELAIEERKFNEFLRTYVSEEFDVDPEFSFLILSVLNYKHIFNVSVSESFVELLKLSSSDTLCQLCITGGNLSDKMKMAEMHNLSIYSGILTNFDSGKDDILGLSDDSMNDKPYEEEDKVTDQASYESTLVNDFLVEDKIPLKFNPFDFSSSSEGSCMDDKFPHNLNMNSTELINPFSDSESVSCSPRDINKCEHCDKDFSNSYNRKLHLVSVHRIYPRGMFIYKCAFPSCLFVNGSKILYSRHVATHTKEILLFHFRLTFILFPVVST